MSPFITALAVSLLTSIQEPGASAAPTVLLEGRVVDVRGEPVPLAEISVATWQQPNVVLAKGTCDGSGYFRIARVPQRESWCVVARHDGYCRGGVIASHEAPVHIQLRDATTVHGVLRDGAGRPVAGGAVRAVALLARWPMIRGSDASYAQTDADGAFTLRDVPLGTVSFVAVVPGAGLAELHQWVRGETDIALAPATDAATTTLSVAVDGVPPDALAGVSTTIRRLSEGVMELPPPWDAPSFDRSGRFELQRVPDAKYVVRVMADGFVFVPAEVAVDEGAGPHRIHFAASPMLHCAVHVLDGDGAAVGGIRCEMWSVEGVAKSATATSAADGTMTFASPAPAGSAVNVKTLGPLWYGRLRATVDPTKTLELRVVPACNARGRVVQRDGHPAPFADVVLREAAIDARMSLAGGIATAITDRDGNFEFGGLRRYRQRLCVVVVGEYGMGMSEPFPLDPREPVIVPQLQLQPPATIEGKLTDAKGPAPGVCLVLEGPDVGGRDIGYGNDVEVITDREGRFRFLGVPPGRVSIEIRSLTGGEERTRAVEPFEVEAGKTHAFDLVLAK